MKLTQKQIEVLDQVAMSKTIRVKDWRTTNALKERGLIKHNSATWAYPEPYYRLTNLGRDVWADIVTRDQIEVTA